MLDNVLEGMGGLHLNNCSGSGCAVDGSVEGMEGIEQFVFKGR